MLSAWRGLISRSSTSPKCRPRDRPRKLSLDRISIAAILHGTTVIMRWKRALARAYRGSRIMNIDTIKFRVKRLSYGLIQTQPLGMPRCYMYLGLMRFPCTVDELLWMHSHTRRTISACR
jgi:hypothetical protein